jgi:hypothetical protein
LSLDDIFGSFSSSGADGEAAEDDLENSPSRQKRKSPSPKKDEEQDHCGTPQYAISKKPKTDRDTMEVEPDLSPPSPLASSNAGSFRGGSQASLVLCDDFDAYADISPPV